MKSLCLFVSYTESDHREDIPLILALQKHFDEVIVLTNVAPADDVFKYLLLSNKGYDFGFVYRALQQVDVSDTEVLGIVNNSQILLDGMDLNGFFDWFVGSSATFCGLTDSFEVPKGVEKGKSYHIQSSFVVLRGTAIPVLVRFFEEIGFERFFEMKDPKKLRQAIIKEIEIGLSQYMIRNQQTLAAWFSAGSFNPRHGKQIDSNMHVFLWEELIMAGYPLMKKKIVNGSWDRLIPNPANRFKYLPGQFQDQAFPEKSSGGYKIFKSGPKVSAEDAKLSPWNRFLLIFRK